MAVRKIVRSGFHIRGTDFLEIPYGTSAQRGIPTTLGAPTGVRVNSETGLLEWFHSGSWKDSGGVISNYNLNSYTNRTSNIELSPNARNILDGVSTNFSFFLDPKNWKVGDASYIITGQNVSGGVNNKIINAVGERCFINGFYFLDEALETSTGQADVFYGSPKVLVSVKYLGDSNFIVNKKLITSNLDILDPTLVNTVTQGNNTCVIDKINVVNSDTGFDEATKSEIILPNPSTVRPGTKIIVVDGQDYGKDSNVGFKASAGSVDGINGDAHVHFHYNGEVITFEMLNGAWYSGRALSASHLTKGPSNTSPISTDDRWKKPGKFYGSSINTANMFGGGWIGDDNVGPTINEEFMSEIVSRGEGVPGQIKSLTVASGRHFITMLKSGKTFTRKVNSIYTGGFGELRSVNAIGGVYEDTRHNRLLEVIASPYTTLAVDSSSPLTLKMLKDVASHEWRRGDVFELINYRGAEISFNTNGDSPSSSRIPIHDENGEIDALPVVMGQRGALKLVYLGYCFKVVYRAYY